MVSEYIFLNSFLKKQFFFYWDSQRPKELFVEKNKYEHTKEIPEIITDEELEKRGQGLLVST